MGFNPYKHCREAIAVAASEIYQAKKAGREPDPDLSRVAPFRPKPNERSRQAIDKNETDIARVNVAAQALARMALLKDNIEQSNRLIGKLARFEVGLSIIFEWSFIQGAFGEDSVIGAVQSQSDSFESAPQIEFSLSDAH